MKSKIFDSLSLFIGKVFDAGIMFIFNILAAKLVGIEQYGIYVFINSTVMLIAIFLKMGIDQGITVIVPRKEDKADKSTTVTSGLILLYIAVILVLVFIFNAASWISGTVLNDISYAGYLKVYAPILLLLPFTQAAEGIFRSIYKIRYYVIGKSVLMPMGIIGSFLAFYYGLGIDGLRALFLCNYVGFGLAALFMFWHMIKAGLLRFTKTSLSLKPYTQLLILSLPLIFLGLHEYLIGRTDAFIIGYFLNEAHVGVFNIADKVAYIASFILVAAGSIVAPKISKHYHNKEFGHLSQVYHESTKMLVLVNTLVFFCLLIVSDWFMEFATGGGYDGWIVLIFLSLAYLIHSMFGPVAYMNAMTGGHQMEFRIALIMILSNIALDVIFLKYMGIKGIAFGTVIVFLIGDIYRSNDMYQKIRIRPSFRNVLIPGVGGFVFLIVRTVVETMGLANRFVSTVVELATFGVVYVIAVYVMSISKEEKEILWCWLRRERASTKKSEREQ